MLFGIFQKLKYCATHIKPVTLKQKRSRTVERQIQKASHRGSLQKPYEDMKMTKKTRNKNGLESDRILLETIKEYPGLSQYELAKKLKWQSGRVDGAIRRLLNEGQVVIKTLERNGRRVNLVYPEDSKPANVVVVPEALLHVGNPTWLDSAFIYALDSTTIGVSGHEMPEWAETNPHKKRQRQTRFRNPRKLQKILQHRQKTPRSHNKRKQPPNNNLRKPNRRKKISILNLCLLCGVKIQVFVFTKVVHNL